MDILIKLLFCHFLADYPLQGDFLSKAKNQNNPMINVPVYQAMFAHSFIQAGFVYLVTRSILFFCIELLMHYVIDYIKCDLRITYNQDQMLHIVCKVMYCLFIVGGYNG